MADRKEASGGEKRKHPRNDAVSSVQNQKRAREGDEGASATDEDVEEFFAILRRIHVAVRYFKTTGEKLPAAVNGDKMLEWASNPAPEEAIAAAGKSAGLDLNLDPGPEQDDPL